MSSPVVAQLASAMAFEDERSDVQSGSGPACLGHGFPTWSRSLYSHIPFA